MLKPKIAPTSLNVSDKVQDLSIIHAINLERLKQDEVVKKYTKDLAMELNSILDGTVDMAGSRKMAL